MRVQSLARAALDLSENVDDPRPPAMAATSDPSQSQTIPDTLILGSDMKSLPSFRKKRQQMKAANMEVRFREEVAKLLAYYPVDAHKYDDELLLCVMQLAEDFFIYQSKCGPTKLAAVIDVMLPYYDGQSALVANQVKLLYPKVGQTTFSRRLAKRLLFFVSVIRQLWSRA